jgi:hypothetical protein
MFDFILFFFFKYIYMIPKYNQSLIYNLQSSLDRFHLLEKLYNKKINKLFESKKFRISDKKMQLFINSISGDKH